MNILDVRGEPQLPKTAEATEMISMGDSTGTMKSKAMATRTQRFTCGRPRNGLETPRNAWVLALFHLLFLRFPWFLAVFHRFSSVFMGFSCVFDGFPSNFLQVLIGSVHLSSRSQPRTLLKGSAKILGPALSMKEITVKKIKG